MIYASVPPSLIRTLVDSYGPAGLFPGGDAPHPISFSLLRLLPRRRRTPDPAPQPGPVSCYCPEPGRSAS